MKLGMATREACSGNLVVVMKLSTHLYVLPRLKSDWSSFIELFGSRDDYQYSDLIMHWTTKASGFLFPKQGVSFLISAACRRGLGPTQWVLVALFRGRGWGWWWS